MEAKITRNQQHNGLNVSFDRKPDANVLGFLKGLGFKWNPFEKVWYKSYSEALEKQVRAHFEGAQVEPDTYKPEIENAKRQKLNLELLISTKKSPRKDVILSEIKAGKMEYAVHKSFDAMTDSSNYHKVTNDSFEPAEDAKYLIDNLSRAIGQSHWVYSARANHDDELGYYIDFSDYYIRYKGEKGAGRPKATIDGKNISEGDVLKMKDSPSYYYISKVFEGSISTKPYLEGYNVWSYGFTNENGRFGVKKDIPIDYFSGDVYGKDKLDSLLYFMASLNWHIRDTYQNFSGGIEFSESQKMKILEMDKTPIGKEVHRIITSQQEPEKPKEQETKFHAGDMVEATEDYLVILKGKQGVVISSFVNSDLIEMVKINFGYNQTGQKIVNTLPDFVLKKVDQGAEKEEPYTVLNNDVVVFSSKEAAHEILSKHSVLQIAYSVSYIGHDYTKIQLGESMPSGWYATKSRPGKGNELPLLALKKSTLDSFLNKETDAEPKAETPASTPDAVAIAKAKAKARIRILKLRAQSKSSGAGTGFADRIEKTVKRMQEGFGVTEATGNPGKKVNPHPEVGGEYEAVRDVIRNEKFSNLDYEDALLISETFWNYKDIEKNEYDEITVYPDKIDDAMFERLSFLEHVGYIEFNDSLDEPEVILMQKGIDLIETLLHRVETRKNVRAGYDLFPQAAGIPELEYEPENEFAEGGTIPISKQFLAIYEIVKKAKAVNVARFAEEIQVLNQYNKPLFDFLVTHRVPIIKVDQQTLKTHAFFKLYPPPIDHAVFWCSSGNLNGKFINNIYVSVLPNAYIGLGSYAMKLKIPYAETMENVYVHEAIHAYINVHLKNNSAFMRELSALREHMQRFIEWHLDDFDDFEKRVWDAMNGAPGFPDAMKPSVTELITYTFTMERLKHFFQKITLKDFQGVTAWDRLLNLVSTNDNYGHLLLYAQKYGDLPKMDLARSVMKYKLYLKQGEQEGAFSNAYKMGEGGTVMENGGRVNGLSHEDGGVNLTVKSTGEKVQLEGGEAVIMEDAVESNKKYEFEGKEVPPKVILDKINRDAGGKPIK
jgi:hypothetical protein